MYKRSQPIATASQLGVVLHSARKNLKLTQAQLATRLGLSQRRISELEREPGTLSVDQLLSICTQLGLQLVMQPHESAHSGNTLQKADW